MPTPPARVAAATALLALVPSCSWLTVTGPPPAAPPPPPWAASPGGPPGLQAAPPPPVAASCTRSKAAPHFDTGVAALYGGTGLLMALLGLSLQGDRDDYNRFMGGMFMVLGAGSVAFAAPFWMSSRSGYRKVDACLRLGGG